MPYTAGFCKCNAIDCNLVYNSDYLIYELRYNAVYYNVAYVNIII